MENWEQKGFDGFSTIINASESHMALVFLLDTSGSMLGEPIRQLNAGLNRFKEEVCWSKQTRDIMEVAIIKFSNIHRVIQKFIPIEYEETLPVRETAPDTPVQFADASGAQAALVDTDSRRYTSPGREPEPVHAPLVVQAPTGKKKWPFAVAAVLALLIVGAKAGWFSPGGFEPFPSPPAAPVTAASITYRKAFPDEQFRAYILDEVIGDGRSSTDSISAADKATMAGWRSLHVSNEAILDLTGIEYFIGLERLDCESNNLTTLDISKNTTLTYLDCSFTRLTTLDVSKNTALTTLFCAHSRLTTLDITNNTQLTSLWCTNNSLTTLDVSKHTKLTSLECSANNLTTLDVSKNIALTSLECSANNLTTLDVSKNTALTRIYCENNNLTTLNVSKNTALTELWCFANNLTTLDVSENTALMQLFCGGNALTTLDVSQNTTLEWLFCGDNNLATLDVSQNIALTWIECYKNNLTTLDVSKNIALELLDCHNNNLTTLDVSRNIALKELLYDENVAVTGWPRRETGVRCSAGC